MTKKEKLEAIYEEIANTDTTIGCRVQTERFGKICKGTILNGTNILRENGEVEENCILRNVEIIGHPVMIGDALEVLDAIAANRDNARYERRLRDILMVRNKPKKPIDEQSDECIDLVYSLIQKS